MVIKEQLLAAYTERVRLEKELDALIPEDFDFKPIPTDKFVEYTLIMDALTAVAADIYAFESQYDPEAARALDREVRESLQAL